MGHVHGVARHPRALNAWTALGLSVLFVAVYSATGWITSLRPDVGTWAFEWEHRLPFVAWMVVPYVSLDLFFIAAPFLCGERAELRTFRRRMATAILAAGTLFLLVPLRFAFPRPAPTGWTADIFEVLYGFDRPYNLFPSLHIAILMILSAVYHRHTRGIVRWLICGWFGLIGVSTVLTYQHHVIDLGGGFLLGLICYYLIPNQSKPQPLAMNVRIGLLYAAASAALGVVGTWVRPLGLVFLWPASSLAIVAGAYFGLYSGITRKENGRLSLAARIVLAPWLAAQHASLIYYRRQTDPWNVVAPNVVIGRHLRNREAVSAVKHGVTAVLDLTSEFSEPGAFLALPYLNLPVLDLTAPTPEQLGAALNFISTHREAGIVYVHCKIGYSRSAAVAGSWLMEAGIAATADEAVARIRAARPSIVVRPEALAALRAFSRTDRAADTLVPRLIEVQT